MKTKTVFIGFGILILLIAGFFLISNNLNLTGEVISGSSDLSGDPDKVTIYFFWGEGCPHCAHEKPFLEQLEQKYSQVEVLYFETWQNQENAELFKKVSELYGTSVQGVPTTFIGDKYWIGYADYMAKEIEDYVKYCIENKCESPLDSLDENCGEGESFCEI